MMARASYLEGQAIEAAEAQRAAAQRRVQERFVPRSQWDAKPAIPGNLKAYAGPYNTVTLHHTGRYETPAAVQNLHLGSENFWRTPAERMGANVQDFPRYGDVGYNYMVGRNGEIYEGRSPAVQGAHTSGHNAGNLGVAVLGDYSRTPLNEAQLASLRSLMTDLGSRYPIKDYATHGEFDPKRKDELKGAFLQVHDFLDAPAVGVRR
jgi:hypothetical protein